MTSEERQAQEPKPGSRPNLWTKLHLDDVTKMLALVGSILYGVLFLAYRAYYDVLNLSPEDVGVDITYILVRSPGFILTTIAGILVVSWMVYGARVLHGEMEQVGKWRFALFIGLLVLLELPAAFVLGVVSPDVSPYVFVALLLVAIVLVTIGPRLRNRIWCEIAAVALIAVVFPAVALLVEAQALGHRAAEGQIVQPWTLLSMPILDVSAVPVQLLWADPKTPHPPYFGNGDNLQRASGLLVGQTSSSVVVNLNTDGGFRIVRFAARQVIVEYQ